MKRILWKFLVILKTNNISAPGGLLTVKLSDGIKKVLEDEGKYGFFKDIKKKLNELNDNDMDKVSGGYTKKGLLGTSTYCDFCGAKKKSKDVIAFNEGMSHICENCMTTLSWSDDVKMRINHEFEVVKQTDNFIEIRYKPNK